MEDKNLEDIVFDRLCRILKNYNLTLEINYTENYTANTLKCYQLCGYNQCLYIGWHNINSLLFGEKDSNNNSVSIFNTSIFEVCEYYNETKYSIPKETKLLIAFAEVSQIFNKIKANSLEEIALNMDMMGV